MSERIQHRGKLITITIDGRECKGVYGQTILEIARENDIYIPTMCYLTKVSPITSCRMCVVNVKGVDGTVLSCQEKAVNGAVITTDNDELYKHRQNIMKMYNVNHPLQCGVCDKSGECDLQNKTLEFGVDSQEFMAKDITRKKKGWGVLSYDPSLCIMCERCVHVCNEVIGASALYVKPGGYSSAIDIKMSRCIQCGECISPCPVGALVSTDYKYTSNAWESQKVPATCAHCSAGCSLYYEVKNDSISNPYQKRITRVTTDVDFATLCAAGRFGFNFENRSVGKDKMKLENVVSALNSAQSIRFNSYITNEEAKILNTIKEKTGIKLINEDARSFKNFLENYSITSGSRLYSADLKIVEDSDAIVMLGTKVTRDNPGVRFAINVATKKQKAQFIYMHSIDDSELQNKYTQFIKYEAGSEEGVIALLASYLIENVPAEYKEYFDDLDIGYLSGECSVGEEELEELVQKLNRRKNRTLIVGQDIFAHENAANIAKLVGLIDRYTEFNVLLVPAQTNSFGVSLICDLDQDEQNFENSIGYNEFGSFIIADNGEGDFQVPALNQQEGTFVDINKRVVNTNVALEFDGYCLNDIANELLNENIDNTIDYTQTLPTQKGFKFTIFDDLDNGFDKYGNQLRGYKLEDSKISVENVTLDEVEDINTYNGTVVYSCEPLHHFNRHTAKTTQIKGDDKLRGSSSFATAAKIKNGDTVNIIYNKKTVTKKFKVDNSLKGTIALYPTYCNGFIDDPIASGYRFKQVQIQKVEE